MREHVPGEVIDLQINMFLDSVLLKKTRRFAAAGGVSIGSRSRVVQIR